MTITDPAFTNRLRDYAHRYRRVLNRLEPHLPCASCRATLIEGVCPECDPERRCGSMSNVGYRCDLDHNHLLPHRHLDKSWDFSSHV